MTMSDATGCSMSRYLSDAFLFSCGMSCQKCPKLVINQKKKSTTTLIVDSSFLSCTVAAVLSCVKLNAFWHRAKQLEDVNLRTEKLHKRSPFFFFFKC